MYGKERQQGKIMFVPITTRRICLFVKTHTKQSSVLMALERIF